MDSTIVLPEGCEISFEFGGFTSQSKQQPNSASRVKKPQKLMINKLFSDQNLCGSGSGPYFVEDYPFRAKSKGQASLEGGTFLLDAVEPIIEKTLSSIALSNRENASSCYQNHQIRETEREFIQNSSGLQEIQVESDVECGLSPAQRKDTTSTLSP